MKCFLKYLFIFLIALCFSKSFAETSGYKPNYFQFFGADDIDNEEGYITCDGKFQISFATPLRNPTRLASDLFTRVVNFTGPLHFGYTQQAFWELCEESLPFSETNYMPEFFWAKNVEVFGRDAVRFIGWEHQSNGRDNMESRGWDRIYARFHFPFLERVEKPLIRTSETSVSNRLAIDFSVWLPVSRGRFNSDITDYYGYGELAATYTRPNQHRYRFVFRKGGNLTDTSRGNLRAEWLLPSKKLGIQWMIQVFSCYGESLQRYNVNSTSVRAGVVFSDYEFSLPNQL